MSQVTTPGPVPAGEELSGGPLPEPASVAAEATCCLPSRRRAWGPPRLPADTALKQGVDRLFPLDGAPAVAYFVAVIGLLALAAAIRAPASLVVEGIAFVAGAAWCALNFWRCRQAHCLVTSTGWLGLGLLTFAEAAWGHSLIGGDEPLIFVAILALGVVLEGLCVTTRGTNAVRKAS